MSAVLIRCDASSAIGFGHLMRCVALADWCRARGDMVRFLIRHDSGAARILQEAELPATWLPASCSIVQANQALINEIERLAASGVPPWVVVDTYEEPDRVIWAAHEAGARVLVIDDAGSAVRHAQIVVNPNLDAEAAWYPHANETRLLLGGSYALLRREFREVLAPAPIAASVRRILVTLGGSDARNRTELIVRGLHALPQDERGLLQVDILLGHGYLHRASLEALLLTVGYRWSVHAGVSHMTDLMQRADLAITAAGGTIYETACLGLPSLVLVLAENQEKNAGACRRHELAVVMGAASALAPSDVAQAVSRLMHDPAARHRMRTRGRALIDGRGPERIRQAMQDAGIVHAGQGKESS